MELDAVKQIDIAKDIAQALSYLHAQVSEGVYHVC